MRKNNQKSGNLFAGFKIMRTFASLLKGSTLAKEFWRGGRVVDCGGLENRWKELQNKENPCKLILYGNFLFLVHGKNKHIKAFFRCTIRCT